MCSGNTSLEWENHIIINWLTNSLEVTICIKFEHFFDPDNIVVQICVTANITWPRHSIKSEESNLAVHKMVYLWVFISSIRITILTGLSEDCREWTIGKGFGKGVKRSLCKPVPPLPSWRTSILGYRYIRHTHIETGQKQGSKPDDIRDKIRDQLTHWNKKEVWSLLEQKLPALEEVWIANGVVWKTSSPCKSKMRIDNSIWDSREERQGTPDNLDNICIRTV